jgi:precorrin isomerase
VWKSSVLALMLHGLKSDSSIVGNAPTGLLSEMEVLAEQKSVRLNGHSAQDLKFVGV